MTPNILLDYFYQVIYFAYIQEEVMEIIQLDIAGMTCASCVGHVEKGI